MKKLKEKNKKIKRDIILLLACLLFSAAAYFIINFAVKKEGAQAVIKVDGVVAETLELGKNASVTVDGYRGGKNTIVVDGKEVYMTDADCPDKLCEKTGRISRTGETIVCLPHRVVVEIQGSGADRIDSVVQ